MTDYHYFKKVTCHFHVKINPLFMPQWGKFITAATQSLSVCL